MTKTITLNQYSRLKREGVNIYHTSDPDANTLTEVDIVYTSENIFEVSQLYEALTHIQKTAISHARNKSIKIKSSSEITWTSSGDILVDGKGLYTNFTHKVVLDTNMLGNLNLIRLFIQVS